MKTPLTVARAARASEPPDGPPLAPDATASETTNVQRILQPHLGPASLKLFHELTGHPLHLIWHSPTEFDDPRRLPRLCPVARHRPQPGRATAEDRCAACQRDNWRPLATPVGDGRLLIGACGSTCFWAALQNARLRVATLVLHAASPAPGFDQAVQLLRQLLLGTQAVLAAELARRDGDRPDPPPSPAPPIPGHDTHAKAIVRLILDYLHAHYQHPIGLADVAAALKMNASYLSHLFSTTMGTGFHHYLAGFRLEKAKDFLRDPTMRVCEVAAAAGYSSPSHFNNVFKAMTGLSPSAWRQANPS